MARRGLIPEEIARLEKVRNFTPNVHAEWQAEEDERSFLEWCRKDLEEQPSMFRDETKDWHPVAAISKFLKGALP